MSKCKHQTGTFYEFVEAEHRREVEAGIVDRDFFMNNDFNGIIGYSYQCKLCGKRWRYEAPVSRSIPQWLRELHYSSFAY